MNTSESIGKLAEALAAAQGEFPRIDRNRTVKVATKTGGSYEFTYATLDHIVELVGPVLAKHGLSVMGGPSCGSYDGRLLHASGEWIESSLKMPDDLGPQDIGSALTYFRRYILCTLLGIAADEDDDGNRASGNTATGKDRRPGRPPAPPSRAVDASTGEVDPLEPWLKRVAGTLSLDGLKVLCGEIREAGLAKDELLSATVVARKKAIETQMLADLGPALSPEQVAALPTAGGTIDPVVAGALEEKTARARSFTGKLTPKVLKLLERSSPWAAPDCTEIGKAMVQIIGSAKYEAIVKENGGDPAMHMAGCGLEQLRIITAKLVDVAGGTTK